ncbi:leucine-rich repeat and WD repeat-containing protein 1-like isoform X1 [Eriocheir sinensis]|uniref:leucine-rich repeat and WD repeat-containing protein 1-like isoform X1 n=1 Tax=Eriocheir sinensis TaxID=95602 RepID=UPI0021C81E54|nr:leucine-rich repeat and WD repeat-containing protein 1-like isoform X1 [Eriocheir sinensis]
MSQGRGVRRKGGDMAEKGKGGGGKKKQKTGGRGAPQRQVEYKFDPSFKLREPKVERVEGAGDFHPVFFLRTHSKNNDTADVQTQIWQCSFEPDNSRAGGNTSIVATCGGSSVCFINVLDGEVVLKYNRSTKTLPSLPSTARATAGENLYAQVWSTLPLDDLGLKTMNVLAAAGARSTVLLIHPDAGICYQMFRTVPNKAAAVICALLFHPKKATWLFCGHEDGQIQLWDIGTPTLPEYEVSQVHLLTIPPVARDVYNLAFSCTHDLLIGGCDGGLYAWKVDLKKIEAGESLERLEFVLPEVDGNGSVLDSISMLRDDLLAAKCALHGQIYVFSVSKALSVAKLNKSRSQLQAEVKTEMMVRLRWSDTDNYYMNMGLDSRSCLLVCGDDKGALWVYDLADLVTGRATSPLTGGAPIPMVEPVKILEWPELEDAEVEKARKLRLDTYDIVVDKCTVSYGAQHIVAVTSNNMVCIWRHGKEEEEEEEAAVKQEEAEKDKKKKKKKKKKEGEEEEKEEEGEGAGEEGK